ncbi:MAG: sugar ABC transporter substrate-binding protein [Planctomycetes bacterium]|nr:sugar ABC transporter substrate-binding protein [Planctomycetota bacterium]
MTDRGPACFFLVLSLLAAGGCGGRADSRVVLKVWDWWSPASSPALKQYFHEVERAFEADHPQVDLRYQFVPFGDTYSQKLMTGLSSSEPPDCFQTSIIWARDLYERGALMSLTRRMASDAEVSPDHFFEAVLPYCSRGGDFYGVPMAMDANVLLYNVDLFEAAGLDASPESIRSWDEMAEAARKLTRRDPETGDIVQAGYLVDGASAYFTGLLPWIYANSGGFYNGDETAPVFRQPAVREAIEFMTDLLYTHEVSLPLTSNRQDLQLFIQGKVGMMMAGTWSGYMLTTAARKLRFGMTSFPPGPSGVRRATCTWGNMYVIPRNARRPDLAWEFVRFYCGRENAARMLKILSRNSPRKDLYETGAWREAVRQQPYLAEIPKICALGGRYPMARFNEVNDAFRPLYQGVLLRSRSAEDALRLGEAAVLEILRSP